MAEFEEKKSERDIKSTYNLVKIFSFLDKKKIGCDKL